MFDAKPFMHTHAMCLSFGHLIAIYFRDEAINV